MSICRLRLRAISRIHGTRGTRRVAVIGVALVMVGVIGVWEAPPAFAWKAPQVAALCATDASTFRFQVTLANEPNGKMEWSWNQTFTPNTDIDLVEPGTSTVLVPRGGHAAGDTWRIRFRDDINAKSSAAANGNLCATATAAATPALTPAPTPVPTPTPAPTPASTPSPALAARTPGPTTATFASSIQSTPAPAPTQQTAVLSLASLPLTGGSASARAPSALLLIGMSGVSAFLVGFGVFVLSLNRQERREEIRIRAEDDERA